MSTDNRMFSSILTTEDIEQMIREGWIVYTSITGHRGIGRYPTNGRHRFAFDTDAAEFVRQCAALGSSFHRRILNIVPR